MKSSLFFIYFLLIVLAVLPMGTLAAEADSTVSGDGAKDSSSTVESVERNIPLPRQTAYTGKGLSVGIAGGIYNPTEECDCMGVWQGQLEFFYASWISGGIDVRFLGGDLDSDVMLMYQRYRLNLRFHKAFENLDLYVEPVLGLENTSISEFREQVKNHTSNGRQNGWYVSPADTTDADSTRENCEKMFSLDGFSLGMGAGFGYNLSRLWGLTGSVLVEYNFSGAVQLTLTPGIGFNVREIWPWSKKTLRSTWLMLEIGTQRFFNRGVHEWATFGFFGFQIGA